MLGHSRKLDATESAKRPTLITPFFESGEFRPLPVRHVYDLDQFNFNGCAT